MARKRERKPVVTVEVMLYAEAGIRQAVEEKRREVRFYPNGDMNGSGTKSAVSDRTGNTVLKLSEEIESVFVAGAGTVSFPEKWLACFDEVRGLARQYARPEIILDEWTARYTIGRKFIFELMSGRLDSRYETDRLILWIIYHVEEAAFRRGLLAEKQCSLYGRDLGERCVLVTGEPEKI